MALLSTLSSLVIRKLEQATFLSYGQQAELRCFFCLTCLHSTTFILLSIFSLVVTISLKIWGTSLSWHAKESSKRSIIHGVLQGSILGPNLFNIHINDLCKICGNTEVFLYADNTKLHASPTDMNEAERSVNENYQYRLLVETKRTIDIPIGCRENLF